MTRRAAPMTRSHRPMPRSGRRVERLTHRNRSLGSRCIGAVPSGPSSSSMDTRPKRLRRAAPSLVRAFGRRRSRSPRAMCSGSSCSAKVSNATSRRSPKRETASSSSPTRNGRRSRESQAPTGGPGRTSAARSRARLNSKEYNNRLVQDFCGFTDVPRGNVLACWGAHPARSNIRRVITTFDVRTALGVAASR